MARIGKNQLIKLFKKYPTDESIARLYNITRQAVYKLRKQYGISAQTDKHSQRNEEICTLFSRGISVIKLSKKFQLTTTHIYRILKKNKNS